MSNPPNVARILETSLYVSSLGASSRFYEKVFGFEVVLRDRRMCAMAVPGRQVLLLFVRGGSAEPSSSEAGMIPAHNGRGTQHLCFSIATSEIETWQQHLEDCHVPLESRLDWPKGGSSLYFRDPDGHSLEVGTPGLWKNDPGG